jgi:uncharacterized OB-fold protein
MTTDPGEDMPPSTLLPLRGVRCASCGHVATPVQKFGCETCGAHGLDLVEVDLAGDGVVLNSVEVHRRDEATVHLGSIHLTEGPMLRAILSEQASAGTRVTASESGGGLVFLTIGEEI